MKTFPTTPKKIKLSILKEQLESCNNISDQNALELKILEIFSCNIENKGALNLKRLDLSGCSRIKDQGIGYLSVLDLTYLNLNRTKVTSSGLEALKDLNLIGLSLSGCNINNKGLTFIPRSVTTLDLSYTKVTDEGFSSLTELSVQNLRICGLEITGIMIFFLKKHPLNYLDISRCSPTIGPQKISKKVIIGSEKISTFLHMLGMQLNWEPAELPQLSIEKPFSTLRSSPTSSECEEELLQSLGNFVNSHKTFL